MKHKQLMASLLLATASIAYAGSEKLQDRPLPSIKASTKEESFGSPASEKMFAGRLANANNKAPVCEYNSELAAAIQTAYETQSGMLNINCEGLSKEQLMSIDFNAIVFPANYLQNLRDRAESALKTTSGNQLEPNEAITEALDYAYTLAGRLITTTI